MSEGLEARSEVLKLARILSAQESDVEFLERLPSGELREFREQVTNRMFDSSSKLLERIASAARLIPSFHSCASPAARRAAAELRSRTSRRGPLAPPRTSLAMAAFWPASPPRIASGGEGSNPSSAGFST